MAFTIPEIEAALRANRGLITGAARMLTDSKHGEQISRQGVAKRIRNSERLQQALADIEEEMKDVAEGSLFDQIASGDGSSTRWYLGTKARDRGYGQQMAIHGGYDEEGRPIAISSTPSVIIMIPDNGRDPGLVDVTPQRAVVGKANGHGDGP